MMSACQGCTHASHTSWFEICKLWRRWQPHHHTRLHQLCQTNCDCASAATLTCHPAAASSINCAAASQAASPAMLLPPPLLLLLLLCTSTAASMVAQPCAIFPCIPDKYLHPKTGPAEVLLVGLPAAVLLLLDLASSSWAGVRC